MFEVEVLPSMMNLGAQLLVTAIFGIVVIVFIYLAYLVIKALKKYINKDS